LSAHKVNRSRTGIRKKKRADVLTQLGSSERKKGNFRRNGKRGRIQVEGTLEK